MTKPLTAQQEKFVLALMAGKNQSDAYREAYKTGKMTDKSIHEKASELAANVKVAARLTELRNKASEKAVITAADVLREGMRLATFDIRKLYRDDGSPIPIHELDEDTARCIQGVDVLEEYAGTGKDRVFVGYTKKYKVADKNVALEKLFKHFGLYEKDNQQKTDPITALMKAVTGGVVKPGTTFQPGQMSQEAQDDDD